MATKKQKREAALAKRAAFLAQLKADGLRSQEIDRHDKTQTRQANAAAAKEIIEDSQLMMEPDPEAIDRLQEALYISKGW